MKTPIKVAINGFGRIGRAFLKMAIKRPEIEVVAINDLGDLENLAYLLKYDTVYPDRQHDIKTRNVGKKDQKLIVNDHEIPVFTNPEPSELPWSKLGVDIVVEATGFFASYEKSNAHIKAGAKRVVISAPAKSDSTDDFPGATVLMGVNESALGTCQISSNGSCTTNASSPLISILDEAIGIEKAILNTIHGYTATQAIVDSPNKKDFRKGRAAAMNIIPTTTGAAIAVTKAFPKLSRKFDGIAARVPVIAGSLVDVTLISSRPTSESEVNDILKKAATEERWRDIFTVTEEKIVSSDILGLEYASIADLGFTKVVDGNLVKVLAWYDNEAGYTKTLVSHVIQAGKTL